jgi:WD40 repeat protein
MKHNNPTHSLKRVALAGATALLAAILVSSMTSAATLFAVHSPEGPGQLMTLDTTTGAPTVLGPTSSQIDGLAFAPDGTLFAADNSNHQLVILDRTTGSVLTVVGSYGATLYIEALAFRPSDSVLFGVGIDVGNVDLCTLDTATGAVSMIGPLGVVGMAGLAFNLDGSVLYAVGHADGCLYTVDQITGATTSVGCGGGMSSGGPLGLARDPVSGTLFVAEWWGGMDSVLSTVSAVDGSRTTVGEITGFNQVEGITFDQEVPVELISFSVE